MSNDINSSTITCNSTHLTSFAVLVDVSGGHQVANLFLTWEILTLLTFQLNSQNLIRQ